MTLDQDEALDRAAEPHSGEHETDTAAAPWSRDRGRLAGLWAAFRRQPILNGALAALCIAVTVLAVIAIGPASQSGGQTTRTSMVKRGVVQSTVSGSGSVQSASDLNLGFRTSGTVTHIYVNEGQEVAKGQLLATLDSQSAEVSLEQAKATLKSAEANLTQLEENEGESTSSSSSPTASAASTSETAYTTFKAPASSASEATTTTTTPTTTTTTPTTSTPATTTPTTTTSAPTKTTTSGASTKPEAPASSTESSSPSSSGGSGGSEQSEATREANLASSRATVKSDKLSVESAEKAVQNTKLYAPESGTIVSLFGEVGETVSGTGTTRAESSSSSSSSSSSAGGGASPSSSGSSSPSSSEGSSAAFAVLNNLHSLQLVAGLSESEIGQVHVGQVATVAVEALNGRKVAARVVKVGQVPSSSSGAVSYDVTFQLDQNLSGVKVGMSATAEVVVKQAEGLNVPTSAIKGGSVTVVRNGKHVTQAVTTGLAGDSTTIILSGLKEGEEIVQTVTTGSSSSSSSPFGSGGNSRPGGLSGGLGGGGFPGGAGGFPAGGPPG